jgi:hypothetical protein
MSQYALNTRFNAHPDKGSELLSPADESQQHRINRQRLQVVPDQL